jgi:hypothetical protein
MVEVTKCRIAKTIAGCNECGHIHYDGGQTAVCIHPEVIVEVDACVPLQWPAMYGAERGRRLMSKAYPLIPDWCPLEVALKVTHPPKS